MHSGCFPTSRDGDDEWPGATVSGERSGVVEHSSPQRGLVMESKAVAHCWTRSREERGVGEAGKASFRGEILTS